MALIALLGGAACDAKSKSPSAPAVSTPADSPRLPAPACSITASLDGRTAIFNLNPNKDFDGGASYGIGRSEYTFGDGTGDLNGTYLDERHTYQQAGTYAVQAAITISVAPGVAAPGPDAPFKNGHSVPCTPYTVTVR